MTTQSSIPNCLLCENKHVVSHQSLRNLEIMKCWEVAGINFSQEAVKTVLNEPVVHLFQCQACGFEFFDPKLAAGARFYEELQAGSPDYYSDSRPENIRNVQFALRRGHKNILDVGCGIGSALDAARSAGLKTYGVELNTSAATEASKRGHTIFPVLLEDMEKTWEGKFDLITLNQLLEHVPNPVNLIRQCVRFLSADGTIAVAVPGSHGILRFNPWLESNWPPHHISRWRQKDFRTLAARSGLHVIKSGGDQLLGAAIQQTLLGHRDRCATLNKPSGNLPPSMIKILSFVYRKTGMKFIFPLHGLSIYCYMKR